MLSQRAKSASDCKFNLLSLMNMKTFQVETTISSNKIFNIDSISKVDNEKFALVHSYQIIIVNINKGI